MNNTKIAVVFSQKMPYRYIIDNMPVYAKSLMRAQLPYTLPKNYDVQFFFYSDTMNALEIAKSQGVHTVWFKNTIKALEYGVNTYFEPDVIICIGSPNFNWDNLAHPERLSFFIHDSYDAPREDLSVIFDKCYTLIQEDIVDKEKTEVRRYYDSYVFAKKNKHKYFERVFPQKIKNTDLFNDLQNPDNSVVFGKEFNDSRFFNIVTQNKSVLNDIINSSKVTCLIERENDIELALNSLACGVPVVTTPDLKSSKLPSVIVSNATLPDYENAIQLALKQTVDIELDKHTLNMSGLKWNTEIRKIRKQRAKLKTAK